MPKKSGTHQDPGVKDSPRPLRRAIQRDVAVDGVTFGYKSHEPMLDGVKLQVKPGEMIGLVGEEGQRLPSGGAQRIAIVNRLMVLERGKIAEAGTHDELMHHDRIYHKPIMTQRRMADARGV